MMQCRSLEDFICCYIDNKFKVILKDKLVLACRHFNEVESSLREGTWDNLLQGTVMYLYWYSC